MICREAKNAIKGGETGGHSHRLIGLSYYHLIQAHNLGPRGLGPRPRYLFVGQGVQVETFFDMISPFKGPQVGMCAFLLYNTCNAKNGLSKKYLVFQLN